MVTDRMCIIRYEKKKIFLHNDNQVRYTWYRKKETKKKIFGATILMQFRNFILRFC